jgi:hypothetical protein
MLLAGVALKDRLGDLAGHAAERADGGSRADPGARANDRILADRGGPLDVGERLDRRALAKDDRPALRVQHRAGHDPRLPRDVDGLGLDEVRPRIHRAAHHASLEEVPRVLHDLPRTPADQVRAGAREKRLHLGGHSHVLERAVRVSLAQVAHHVLHAGAPDLRREEDALRDVAHLLRRSGHEVEHLVVRHAETAVHEHRVVLGGLGHVGVREERLRPILEMRPHEEVDLGLREREREFLREREDPATKREDGAKEGEGAEGPGLDVLVDAEIHPRTVESGRSAVKSPTMPPCP